MSYIVPDKIPSYCAECDWSICLYPNAYCKRVHKTSELLMATEKRPDFCPLIEIPTPHGRLIDADALWDRMYKYSDNEGAKMPFGDNDFMIHKDSACELIEDAPTIIEAED